MSPSDSPESVQRGTPEEHLRYMLDYGLKWVDGDVIARLAEVLLSHLGAYECPRDDGECRPGACNCDGAHDALNLALDLYRRGHRPSTFGALPSSV